MKTSAALSRFLCFFVAANTVTLAGCSQTAQTTQASDDSTVVETVDNALQLRKGPIAFTVTPQIGGRIAALEYNGQQLLITPEDSDNLLWGNVFWSGPQKDWGWPPLPVLDSEPYELERRGERLVLTSGVEPQTGYQFVKAYQFDRFSNDILIDYSIYNRSDETRHVAPWEVSRVPASGSVIFPTGDTEVVTGGMNPIPMEQRGNLTWFDYDASKLNGDHKSMTDGAGGWLAHQNADYVFVKQFVDVPAAANVEGEGEIHIYTDPTHSYIEVEQQGPVSVLAPDESLHWRVRWRVLPRSEHAITAQ